MAALNNERVVQINFIFLSAVLTMESILFQSRVNFFFQAEDGIRDRSPSRGLGDVYKRQAVQFLVAKNLAVNDLPLEALPAVQK